MQALHVFRRIAEGAVVEAIQIVLVILAELFPCDVRARDRGVEAAFRLTLPVRAVGVRGHGAGIPGRDRVRVAVALFIQEIVLEHRPQQAAKVVVLDQVFAQEQRPQQLEHQLDDGLFCGALRQRLLIRGGKQVPAVDVFPFRDQRRIVFIIRKRAVFKRALLQITVLKLIGKALPDPGHENDQAVLPFRKRGLQRVGRLYRRLRILFGVRADKQHRDQKRGGQYKAQRLFHSLSQHEDPLSLDISVLIVAHRRRKCKRKFVFFHKGIRTTVIKKCAVGSGAAAF